MLSLNMEVRIPEETNRMLEVLRALRGVTKRAIITEALVHYTTCVGEAALKAAGEKTTNAIRGTRILGDDPGPDRGSPSGATQS